MLKMIVSDLDGTLLLKNQKKLEPKVFEAVKEAQKHDKVFVAASGRTYHEMLRFFEPVRDQMHFISSDGALLVYKEQTNVQNMFSSSLLKRVFLFTQSQGVTGCLYSGKYLTYYTGNHSEFSALIHESFQQHVLNVSSPDEIKEPIYKISFYGRPQILLPPDLSSEICKVYDDRSWQDFVVSGVNKFSALSALQRQLGILPAETAVFGDNANDVAMLQHTALSFAPAWAKPEALAVSNYRTTDVAGSIFQLLTQNG